MLFKHEQKIEHIIYMFIFKFIQETNILGTSPFHYLLLAQTEMNKSV